MEMEDNNYTAAAATEEKVFANIGCSTDYGKT
jgi:hypothetical protein